MELYKYCTQENMHKAMKFGGLRIGTLLDCRKRELHGDGADDAAEAARRFSELIQEYSARHADKYAGLTGMVGIHASASDITSRDELNFAVDHLVFATSTEYSAEAHRAWLKTCGYDACYKIHSSKRFFRAISMALGNDNYPTLQVGYAVYAENLDTNDVRANFHPAFVKMPLHHEDQKEVRGVWTPSKAKALATETLDPIILQQSTASRYLSPHAVMSADGVSTLDEHPEYQFRSVAT